MLDAQERLAHTAERVSASLPPELTLQPHLPSSIHQQVLEAQLQRTETELQGLIEQEVDNPERD